MNEERIRTLTDLVERAVSELGYSTGRNAIHEYIKHKKDYERFFETPNFRDREAKRQYDDRRDLYAISATRKWIEENKEVRS